MAEIKLNEGFLAEVGALRASGKELGMASLRTDSAGDLNLSTVDAYQEHLYQIRDVILKFEQLVLKDAKDMEALAAALKAADSAGG